MIVIIGLYWLTNAIFAGLAVLQSHSILNFKDEAKELDDNDNNVPALNSAFQTGFFFSVQTFATIGFGKLAPNEHEDLINVIVCVESILGIAAATLITGVTWAKFSIPQNTTIVFSDSIILKTFHGLPSIQFRAGNTRVYGDIVESTFKVAVIKSNRSTGERQLLELVLVQDVWPIFKYCSTVVHLIDSKSPLHGMSYQDMLDDKITFVVLFTGLDTTLDDSVYARRTYAAEEMSDRDEFEPNVCMFRGNVRVDFTKLNATRTTL